MIKELFDYGMEYLLSIPGLIPALINAGIFLLIEIGVGVWVVMKGICMKRIGVFASVYILYTISMVILSMIY